jgi:stage V sporulation protein K
MSYSTREQRQHQRWQEKQRKRVEDHSSKLSSPKKPALPPPAPSNNGKKGMDNMGDYTNIHKPFTIKEETAEQRQERLKEKQKRAQEALDRLTSLPGMGHLKNQIDEILAFREVADKRKAVGLKIESQSLHMVFTGNPGTGKTTAARLIGTAFIQLGLLKSNHTEPPFVEVIQSNLISPFVGVAEQNIQKKFEEARGGVIFIDEAYALNGPYEWNKNMLATIVSCVEDMRDEVLCIIAGYNNEMQEFLDANPGLRSRFPSTIDFPNYELENLIDIAEIMATERDYKFSTSSVAMLMKRLEGERKLRSFGNARTVRNVIEEAIRRHSLRMKSVNEPTKEQLMTLTGADINTEVKAPKVSEKPMSMAGKQSPIGIMISQHLIPKIDPWDPKDGVH